MRRNPFAVFMCLLLLAALAAPAAWATDGEDQEVDDRNVVDTGQLPDSSFVYQVSIADLQNAESFLESRTVQVNGEAVGDLINAEEDASYRWVTLQSLPGEAEAAIEVYLTADQARKIDTFGRYQVTGSTVSVMGQYHLVCGQHDGITDLHAQSVTVTSPGGEQRESADLGEFAPALLLVALGLAFFLYYRRKREELQ